MLAVLLMSLCVVRCEMDKSSGYRAKTTESAKVRQHTQANCKSKNVREYIIERKKKMEGECIEGQGRAYTARTWSERVDTRRPAKEGTLENRTEEKDPTK